ncbi:MAG TPA: extracellular solute-binding protein [Candidatus Binatia bacterium]|nr:extracellular solute-binding protein [Candidatus Binatia bacterium]
MLEGLRLRLGNESTAQILILIVILPLILILTSTSCTSNSQREVVVYASQDQVYAEPILHEFTRESGTKVRAVYDSEMAKTVTLVNRLLAEKANPQCDVFWNNEELRTRQLAARGVLTDWAGFGYRSRRIIVNTNFVSLERAPKSLSALTNAEWRGRVAFAYPLFGTTATHFLALRQHWGPREWETWCRALQANKPFLVEGNSVVVKFVGRGEAWIGLTDSDDVAVGQSAGLPIAASPLNDESLLISNTVGITQGARHPEAAHQLFNYLQSSIVVERLIAAHALEGASAGGKGLKVNWDDLLRDLDAATETLRNIFLR